jgi:RNA polymerase sigma-70 factor, ECF subfamily
MENVELFENQRSLLFAIAYRMLGSVSDAEDLVQETFLRWQQVESETLRSPKAYLTTIITRLCIDRLRDLKKQRESYVGMWLPEPLISEEQTPLQVAMRSDSLSIAFLVMLEHLSPIERATFLLREIFEYDYDEISTLVNKSTANCRQILCRARRSLSRKAIEPNDYRIQQERVREFIDAWNAGDVRQLISLMTEDVVYISDGGGKYPATHRPMQGSRKIAHFLITIRRDRSQSLYNSHLRQINGQPGIVNFLNGYPQSVICLEFKNSYISSIFAIVDPDKIIGF